MPFMGQQLDPLGTVSQWVRDQHDVLGGRKRPERSLLSGLIQQGSPYRAVSSKVVLLSPVEQGLGRCRDVRVWILGVFLQHILVQLGVKGRVIGSILEKRGLFLRRL